MRGRGLLVLLIVPLVVSVLPITGPASAVPKPPAPRGSPFADIPAWYVNDRWTYMTHAVTSSPDGTVTDTTLVLNMTVTEVRTEILGGVAYSVYNATTDRTVRTSGQFPVPSLGPRPFNLTGTTQGWVWTDRSNLAIVRTNETGTATGVLRPSPFPNVPITADGAATVTFLPPEEDFDFPLEIDDAWSYNVTANTTGYVHLHAGGAFPYDNTTRLDGETQDRQTLWFDVTENVTVPAGPFPQAAHLYGVSPSGASRERWYHTSAKNEVRSVSRRVTAPDNYTYVWTNLTALSLVSPVWPGAVNLSPPRVNPGGWVRGWGTANPFEDLVVSIPVTQVRYSVRADVAGLWSVDVRAPTMDDFTPANADVGSHGVIVEPATAPAAWAIATVQLLVPDLSVDPSDPILSNPTPQMGVPVDVNGTVHTDAIVCVCSPFNVSFGVDGIEVGRYALNGLAGNSSQTFGVSWTPAPGWHTLSFDADPDDAIAERDEANNTATRRVFVAGPDLAPVDIVVVSDTTASYPDPAAVGYVSAPVQGRLGATVNVTFQAENVGTANASAPFTVAVVETRGLWGPPAGPRLRVANVTSPLVPTARAGPWTASWPVPAAPGVYHLNVTVDADAQVAETFESNNTFAVVVNVSGPDYRISLVDAPPRVTIGSAHPINVTVENAGQLDADRDVTLAAYAGASPSPFAAATIPPLAVGQALTTPFLWAAPPAGGVVTVRFAVDSGGVLEEMLETNNEAVVTVDVRERPVTRIVVQGRNVTTSRPFITSASRFVLAAMDRSGTGLTTLYRLDGQVATAYAGPFRISGEGDHTIVYWSLDNLGGREADQTFPVSVDDTPPTSLAVLGEPTYAANETYVTSLTPITLQASDGGSTHVGVASIEYQVDGGAWANYTAPFPVPATGGPRHTIAYRGTDLLGNVETPRAFAIVVDDAPPVTTAEAADRAGDRLTVTLSGTDAGAGVLYTEYRVDGGAWINYTGPFPVQGLGDHNITFRSVDRLHNVERDRWIAVTIIQASPAVNLKPALAAALAALLLAFAVVLGRGRGWSPASPRGVGIAFAAAEVATGVVSAATRTLAVPPYGAGLAVDLVVFLAGLGAVLLVARRRPAPESVPSATDK